jgi:hypothetical protein
VAQGVRASPSKPGGITPAVGVQSKHRLVARRGAWTIEWSMCQSNAQGPSPDTTSRRAEPKQSTAARDDALPPRALILASGSQVRKGAVGASRISKACGGGRGGRGDVMGVRRGGTTHERRVLSPRHPQSKASSRAHDAPQNIPPPGSQRRAQAKPKCLRRVHVLPTTTVQKHTLSKWISPKGLLACCTPAGDCLLPISNWERCRSLCGRERPWVGVVACCVSSCPWPGHNVHGLSGHVEYAIHTAGWCFGGGWLVGCLQPFPRLGWLWRRGDVSSPCCLQGQTQMKCWFFHLSTVPTTTHTHRQAGRQEKEDQEASTPPLLPNQSALNSGLQLLPRSATCVSCPAPTHPLQPPPPPPLHRTSTMLLQRGVFLSCLLASAVAFAPSMRAPRAVSYARR